MEAITRLAHTYGVAHDMDSIPRLLATHGLTMEPAPAQI